MCHLLSHTGGMSVAGFPGYAAGKPVPALVHVLDGSGPANTDPAVVVCFLRVMTGSAHVPAAPQVLQQLLFQSTTGLNIEATIDRFV